MIKKIFIIFCFLIFSSCSSNTFIVEKIINGNTVELNNGIIITLSDVRNNPENISILEHYLKGKITLYNKNQDQISSFNDNSSDFIVYNLDGDCINDLLKDFTQVTKVKDSLLDDNDSNRKSVTVDFVSQNGVLEIPVIVNGEKYYFIFDSGASLISISQDVAEELYKKGSLKETDFVGKRQFINANGEITEGSIVNLKSIVIGEKELVNVQACVTKGLNAPLLFGQSAMNKFGKVSIDYVKNKIVFE